MGKACLSGVSGPLQSHHDWGTWASFLGVGWVERGKGDDDGHIKAGFLGLTIMDEMTVDVR